MARSPVACCSWVVRSVEDHPRIRHRWRWVFVHPPLEQYEELMTESSGSHAELETNRLREVAVFFGGQFGHKVGPAESVNTHTQTSCLCTVGFILFKKYVISPTHSRWRKVASKNQSSMSHGLYIYIYISIICTAMSLPIHIVIFFCIFS